VSLAATLVAAVLAASGCVGTASGTPAGPAASVAPAAAGASAVPGTSPDPGSDASAAADTAAALDALLAQREHAVLAGDPEAFAATVADLASPAGVRQLAAFRSAHDLRPVLLSHDAVPPVEDPDGGVVVRLRYRIDRVDRADRATEVRYRLVRTAAGWRVAAEEATDGGGAAPWLAMPGMRVERGQHAVVAGTADDAALAEAVATVDAVLPGLARQWHGTPDHVLVLVPDTPEQTDALLGRGSRPVGDVAATTEGPLDADGLATGDRVVLDPDARARLRTVGREVVLAHELAHVAVRATVPGSAPGWLSEGYADHVGYDRADVPATELAAPLLRAVRGGTAPTELPTAEELDPTTHDIEVGYLASWQAVETVADRHGEATLRALVRACVTPDGEAAAEQRCDRAMPDVLGEDRAEVTRAWRQRLASLAG